jgi:membrane-associated phospholipid phosphatase
MAKRILGRRRMARLISAVAVTLTLLFVGGLSSAVLAPGVAAQETSVETSVEIGGDVLKLVLPATAYVTTWIKDDSKGRLQFYKSFLLNVGTTAALKLALPKDRPDGSNSRSFPSGHTSIAFQAASFIHIRYGFKYAIPAYGGAAFVGFSREYAGKHYWVDVVSGAVLGTLSSFLLVDRFDQVQVTPTAGCGGLGLQFRIRF